MKLKSTNTALAVCAALVIAIVAIGWFLLISPTNAKLAETADEKANIVDFNDQNKLKLIGLQAAADNLDNTKAVEDRLNGIFPSTAGQLEFFSDVEDAALAAGINPKSITSLVPTAPQPQLENPSSDPEELKEAISQAPIASQTVSMQVTAGPLATQKLIAQLENLERALFLSSVSVTGTGAVKTVSINGYMFIAPPLLDPEEAQAAKDVEATTEEE